ncbi:glycosyltransferase family 2 protein [Erythrobacteraceae bacterium CFH 75059]|nr:glycosyltransferase family 2 protein [Erythrobacteraceae bacterium CFH 75059]
MARIGIVIIGRNEGERLEACLRSVAGQGAAVYVDSGSTDGSVALARSLGVAVVELDTDVPFTAARARNAGLARLLRDHPEAEFVQMVDGDCAVHPEWLSTAIADMADDPRRAVVFGRRRERDPGRNAYHRAIDDEWSVPAGPASACGGDALFRVAALREVGGYNDALIAGEEPEMCLRLRARGWRVWSNGAEMTAHDVAMTHLRQWWHRARRTGFGIAALIALHGKDADRSWMRLQQSALLWSSLMLLAIPGLVLSLVGTGAPLRLLALAPALAVAAQVVRLARSKAAAMGWRGGAQWALLIMIAKLAQARGWLQHRVQQRRGTRATLIEYKA